MAAHLERIAKLAAIIEEHIPMESCAGEPGDAGCSCDEKFSGEYTWKGYCDHLAGKLAAALAACAREARLEEHRLTCTRYAMKQAGHKIETSLECVRCGALERAVGEKANV